MVFYCGSESAAQRNLEVAYTKSDIEYIYKFTQMFITLLILIYILKWQHMLLLFNKLKKYI